MENVFRKVKAVPSSSHLQERRGLHSPRDVISGDLKEKSVYLKPCLRHTNAHTRCIRPHTHTHMRRHTHTHTLPQPHPCFFPPLYLFAFTKPCWTKVSCLPFIYWYAIMMMYMIVVVLYSFTGRLKGTVHLKNKMYNFSLIALDISSVNFRACPTC